MRIFHFRPAFRSLLPLAALAAASTSFGAPTELISNGGFESGDFTGWTVDSQLGSGGNLFVNSGTSSPLNSFSTAGAASGTYYAITDQGGPGAYALIQNFTLSSGSSTTLSFDLFVNDYSGVGPMGAGGPLDYSAGAAQFARVDLLDASAGNFDLGSHVLANFYASVDPGAAPNSYTHYSFDISSYVSAGGTYRLRFAEVDNQLYLNMGVDNVSVQSISGVPGPAAMLAFAGGLLARRRRRA